jgi:uncharacterized membrane protein
MGFENKMALAGVLLFALAIPLILKVVPPNPVYGVRTSKTYSNQELWYAANRSAGITMAIAGVAILVGALVVPLFLPAYSEGARVLVIGTVVISAVVIMVARLLWQVLRL